MKHTQIRENKNAENSTTLGQCANSYVASRTFVGMDPVCAPCDNSVSYTHLDVYKRQLAFQPNDRAADNPHLKFRADGTFHVATPALDAREADPLGELFPQRHDVPLSLIHI